MTGPLSVVMPVFDEAAHLPATVGALAAAARGAVRSSWSSSTTARRTGAARPRGARRAGCRSGPAQAEAAGSRPARRRGRGTWSSCSCSTHGCGCSRTRSFLGDACRRARCGTGMSSEIERESVRRLRERPRALAWPDYFHDPRTTSYGLEDFDRYPKGTTCFLAPRELLLEAFASSSTRYATAARERRHAGDPRARRPRADPPLALVRLHYPPRSTAAFLRQSLHRGSSSSTGTGGASRASSRPSSPSTRLAPRSPSPRSAARSRSRARPCGGGRGRRGSAGTAPAFEAVSFGALAPVYAVAHGAGMWRALAALAPRAAPVILVVFGTTGELIKLAPVLLRLEARGHRYLLATTGQQVQQIPTFLDEFGLRQPDLWLARGAGGRDLRDEPGHPRLARQRVLATSATPLGAAARAPRRAGAAARPRPRRHDDDRARRGDGPGAARAGRAHRERPAQLRPAAPVPGGAQPAPRVAARADPLRARAVGGVEPRSGDVVDTGSNTIRDSLALVRTRRAAVRAAGRAVRRRLAPPLRAAQRPAAARRETLEAARGSRARTPLLFVDHPVTAAAL